MRGDLLLRMAMTAAVSALLLGCAGTPRPTLDPVRAQEAQAKTPGAPAAETGRTAEKAMAAAQNRFGFQLLSQLAEAEGNANVFFSPASVNFCLAMVYNGVGGETKEAVAKTLEIAKINPEQVNAGNAALRQALANGDTDVQVVVANAIWAGQGTTFHPDFVGLTQKFYGAEAGTLNFADPSALETINGWVSKQTNKKIEKLFDAGDLRNATAVLANAVYFKGKWTTTFDKKETRDGAFTLPDGTTKTLPMMSRTGSYAYFKDKEFEAICLPYGNDRFGMYVFLPAPTSSLAAFRKALTAEKWDEWMPRFQKAEIQVSLPRFTVEYETSLNQPLSDLGMGVAFGKGADFAPMGLPGHYLSLVKHKAVMEVNEEGTEAAAATGGVTTVSLKPHMEVNRPFFCAIRDGQTGALLFLGSITDPK